MQVISNQLSKPKINQVSDTLKTWLEKAKIVILELKNYIQEISEILIQEIYQP